MLQGIEIACNTLSLNILTNVRDTAHLQRVTMESAASATEYLLMAIANPNTINNQLTLRTEATQREIMAIQTAMVKDTVEAMAQREPMVAIKTLMA